MKPRSKGGKTGKSKPDVPSFIKGFTEIPASFVGCPETEVLVNIHTTAVIQPGEERTVIITTARNSHPGPIVISTSLPYAEIKALVEATQ